MAATPESKVKKKVVEMLKQRNAYYFYPVTGGYGSSGVPDIVACLNGHFIGIEVKADLKKRGPTELQKKNLRLIAESGGIALVIDANNLDDLKDVLELI
jgi:Holliday junction resolvase